MEVRSSLKSFGSGPAAQPFAWLQGQGGTSGPSLPSGLSGLAQLGSSLGGLAVADEGQAAATAATAKVRRVAPRRSGGRRLNLSITTLSSDKQEGLVKNGED